MRWLLALVLFVPSLALAHGGGTDTAGRPGTWARATSNAFADVAVTRAEHDAAVAASGSIDFWGALGPRGAIEAWCGGAFDAQAGRMLITCGGHTDYGGNEIYAVDFAAGRWERVTDPSPLAVNARTPSPCDDRPAAGPIATHTYDGLAWHARRKALFVVNDNTGYSPTGCQQPNLGAVWSWRPSAGWARHPQAAGQSFAMAAYSPDHDEIWGIGQSTEWATIVGGDGTPRQVRLYGNSAGWSTGTMAYDATRQAAWLLANRQMWRVQKTPRGELTAARIADLPQAVNDVLGAGAGMAVRDGVLWLWNGQPQIVTYDPAGDAWRVIDPASGDAPGFSGAPVYGKWAYWPARDVFVGVAGAGDGAWIYTPGTGGTGSLVDPTAVRAKIGAPGSGPGQAKGFASLAAALDALRAGDTLTILPGTWREAGIVRASGVTIRAAGAHLTGAAAQGKAALVVAGDDVTIEGLECSGIAVADGNGACIRGEGRNLTLRKVHFRDSEQGFLGGGGTTLVEDSRFERLGNAAQAHGIYVTRGDALIIRRSRFLASKDEGHEVKSRAARTVIEDTVIDSQDGVDSRLVDVPNGGILEIRDSTLRQGPNTSNWELIGYGLEGVTHAVNRITITGNAIANTARRATFLRVKGAPAITETGNTFSGLQARIVR